MNLKVIQIRLLLLIQKKKVGTLHWGYSSHLHKEHGPEARKIAEEIKSGKHPKNENAPTYAFALVVCQHPDKKFLIVKECCKKGWWLPAGRVDPGETFQQAAIRETIEEAGIKIKLEGVLRVEYSPFPDGGARARVVFFASPEDPEAPLKSIPDFESLGAEWITYNEMEKRIKEKKMYLRGNEPLDWFGYITNGGKVHPMSILTKERTPI